MHGLTIVTGKNSILLNPLQEFIKIEAWAASGLSLCLQHRLSYTHSIVAY